METEKDGVGDDPSFRFLQRMEGPLLRYAMRMLRSEEKAQDAVQETFLRWIRIRPHLPQGREAAWLFAVCRTRALDMMRRERPVKPIDDGEAQICESVAPTPEEVLEQSEAVSEALSALERLPEREQEVLRLKLQEGLSYREISEVTGLSVSHVGVMIHTAIQKIRLHLQKNGLADEAKQRRSQ